MYKGTRTDKTTLLMIYLYHMNKANTERLKIYP